MRLIVTPDLNVLLAASRSDHPQHPAALPWLQDAISACATGGGIEVLPMVAAGFLRLATNPKVFPSPTPIRAAIDFIDSLLAIPGVEMPELGREWPTLRELASAHNLSANDLTDAWIAAAVRTIGSHLVTFDRGFTRLLGRSELTILSPASAANL
jgi:toxin-antitoxin system PIN domain toxin